MLILSCTWWGFLFRQPNNNRRWMKVLRKENVFHRGNSVDVCVFGTFREAFECICIRIHSWDIENISRASQRVANVCSVDVIATSRRRRHMGGVIKVSEAWNHCKQSWECLISVRRIEPDSSWQLPNSGEFKFHPPLDYWVMRIERYFLSLLSLSQAINTSLLMFGGISNLRTLPMTARSERERQKRECNRLWKSTFLTFLCVFPFSTFFFVFDSKSKLLGRRNCCLLRVSGG